MNEELKEFKKAHALKVEFALETFIDHCRELEIEFRKECLVLNYDKAQYSGVEHMATALRSGMITVETYVRILPVVTNPYSEYELKPS